VEGTGNGHYIPGRPPVRFNPSVSLPIEEGVGWLVGGGPCRVCAQGSTATYLESKSRGRACAKLFAIGCSWALAPSHPSSTPFSCSHHLIINALPSAARLSRHPHRTHTYARTCSHMRAQTLRFATDIAAPSHTCPPWSASVHRALRHLGRVGICHPRVVRGVHKPTWSASAHRASGTWAAVRT
jgi:hypothetical protein